MRPRRLLSLVFLLILAVALVACGDDGGVGSGSSAAPAGPAPAPGDARAELEHIHGLGVDPASGALYVATHYGLFRATEGRAKLERVGDSRQDIMGFSVAGPGRFIGSGHPDPGQNLPPNLGLIESRDGGASWKNISLLAEADFHVLRSTGLRVYGFNATTAKVMVSADGGREWQQRTPPAAVFDMAIDPGDSRRIVASTERGVFVSPDAGKGWRPLRDDAAGLLAWPARDSLFVIDGQGEVSRSPDAGKTFQTVGRIGGPPVAFVSAGPALYAALGDGNVMRSGDRGATWTLRAAP